jgi:tetrahydromethanopterin S-methyltransferase subunit G
VYNKLDFSHGECPGQRRRLQQDIGVIFIVVLGIVATIVVDAASAATATTTTTGRSVHVTE